MDFSSQLRQRRDFERPQDSRVLFEEDEPKKASRRISLKPGKRILWILIGIPSSLIFLMTLIVFCSTTFESNAYRLPTPPKLEGALAENTLLQNPVRTLNGEVSGPESILVEGDTIYTGTSDGKVLQIVRSSIVKAKRVGSGTNCGSLETEFRCGRPLGIRRLDENRIVVMDAYLGLYAIDFDEDVINFLFDPRRKKFEGRQLSYMNDLVVLNSDEILFTESSSKWNRKEYNYVLMENLPNGRVFKYTISTRELTLVADGLYYPNGIELLPDKQAVIVAETSRARVSKITLSGVNAGEKTIFADNLPGLPNNIRRGHDETFWVGFLQTRHEGDPSLVDALSQSPLTRKALLTLIPNKLWHDYAKSFTTKHTIVVLLDVNGTVKRSLHDPDGHDFKDVSEVHETNEYLYFGSLTTNFIGRVHKHTYEHEFTDQY